MALLWVLNLADGGHSLLDMAERADLPFDAVAEAAERLLEVGLLAEAP
jgi:aminopeptidase-like protein